MRRSLLGFLALIAVGAAACGYADPYAGSGPIANESPGPSASPSVSPGQDDFNTCKSAPGVTYPDGLKVADLKVGTGDVAQKGNNATVQYTGWLTDGKSFDSSRQAGRSAFTFQIGSQQVIGGWDEGVPGMKIGGKRCLTIPAALGYGAQGQTDQTTGATIIPPNATLIFAIELVSLAPGPSPTPPTPSPSPSPSPSK
ncbi:MAG TPA: FKBP-type peptidyl-prolyl cis-trans isomerase [Candidatus Dormibacteraeota bacterium]|nr:FKBP-type peptidyl-prolyl cis-trans isomerase [Candidatus Dormibacteraeota bacterium]